MKHFKFIMSVVAALSILTCTATAETIEKIIIKGNKKVSRDTILFYMKSAEKTPYSEKKLKDDFHSLWKTGFFEDISMDSETGAEGKIVTLSFKENPVITSVTFKTGSKLKEKDIREKLLENNITLMASSYYSPKKMARARRIIKDMLSEKGYNDGQVHLRKEGDSDRVKLAVEVVQGHRTKVGTVVFPGLDKKKVSPSFLVRGMKTNKPHQILSVVSGKDQFKKEKLAEDLEEIKSRLQQKGYLEAKVGEPRLSKVNMQPLFGHVRKMYKIEIPVDMGPRYKVGNISLKGNKVIRKDFLKTLVKMKMGEVYNAKKRDKSIESMLEVYRSLGYIYAFVSPQEDLDPVEKRADLVLNIQEGEVAYVGKVNFKGNRQTRDHVIRREWFLSEGERINMTALNDCLTRIKQLGLVDIEAMPEIKPNPQNPQKVDIDVTVKELNRQSVMFNCGYSAYDGLFVALNYSTQNFLGRGEAMGFGVQYGTIARQYSFSFTEPYLFNLPVNVGFRVHKTDRVYEYAYTRKSKGFSFSGSGRLWRYLGASLSYSYEDVNTTDVNENIGLNDSLYNYLYTGKISSLSPTVYYSSVDSPLFPSRGTKVLFSYRYSGGVLGGDVDLHRIRLQLAQFIPLARKHGLAFQGVYQHLSPFGNGIIPYWESLQLVGDSSVRGFKYLRATPYGDEYKIGNKAFHLNAQYQFRLNQQLSFILFYDVGNVYAVGEPLSLDNVYSSMGMEIKVFMPMLNVPFRLIFAYNPRTFENDEAHFQFRIGMGAMFQ